MDLAGIYREEDLFPREITFWVEHPLGFLFCNPENKDSYDSNHAPIFRDNVKDLKQVLEKILRFYTEKSIPPVFISPFLMMAILKRFVTNLPFLVLISGRKPRTIWSC